VKIRFPPAARLRGLGLGTLFLVIATYYLWRPTGTAHEWTTQASTGIYHQLTQGFLSGTLSLPELPAPELVELKNPYDPALNTPWRRDNLSYYQGKYYLYHSPVPVLVLFAPVKILTGRFVAEDVAVALFCLIGTFAAIASLVILRMRHFPKCPLTLLLLCVSVFGFGAAQFALLRNATVNHVAIASGFCFLTLAFFALLRALQDTTRTARWLAIAGVAHGLAIASRPNYVYSAFAVGVILLPWLWRRRTAPSRPLPWEFILQAIALVLPIAVIGGLMAWHNFARFEDPLEFGMRYMLGGWNQSGLANSSFSPLRENAWYYLAAPGEYHRYFPFVTAPTWMSIGVLLQAPFVFCSLLLLGVREQSPARWFAIVVGTVGFVILATLLLLPSGNEAAVVTSANVRYLPDFVPAFTLLAGIGVLAAGHAWHARPFARRMLVGITLPLALWTVVSSLSLDCQRLPPESYPTLARGLNLAPALLEKIHGQKHGAVMLEVVFPPNRAGHREPLLQTGAPEKGDLVWVRYEANNRARFGHANVAAGGPESEAIAIDFAKPHRIEIELGALVPSIGHPVAARFDEASLAFLRRRIRIRVDGEIVLDAATRCQPATPGEIQLGVNRIGPGLTEEIFTGKILSSARLPITPPDRQTLTAVDYGAVRLKLVLPLDRAGQREPLIASGVNQAGDLVFVHYENATHVRIGFDHWGRGGPLSDPIPVDYTTPQIVEIALGSLYPPAADSWWKKFPGVDVHAVKSRIAVSVNGRSALDAPLSTYESSAYDVTIGTNLLGASTCSTTFTGKILATERLPPRSTLTR
jgi:hypothetical protein